MLACKQRAAAKVRQLLSAGVIGKVIVSREYMTYCRGIVESVRQEGDSVSIRCHSLQLYSHHRKQWILGENSTGFWRFEADMGTVSLDRGRMYLSVAHIGSFEIYLDQKEFESAALQGELSAPLVEVLV